MVKVRKTLYATPLFILFPLTLLPKSIVCQDVIQYIVGFRGKVKGEENGSLTPFPLPLYPKTYKYCSRNRRCQKLR